MASTVNDITRRLLIYSFGLFNYILFFFLGLKSRAIFRKTSERDQNEFDLARNDYWALSKTVFDLHHRFHTLRNGLQLHYLTTQDPTERSSGRKKKNLVILLHGWPDTAHLWRYVLKSSVLRENSTCVAVDLPGFGGSDSFPTYGATDVLEALTEFIVAMREQCFAQYSNGNHQDSNNGPLPKVFIMGHDWGCVLAYRLAAEAPALADRFILTNGPHASLAIANKDRILTSSKKMLMTFFHAPLSNYHCISKALQAIKPLAVQVLRFGYIAAFHLPGSMVKYLATGGNFTFPRGVSKREYWNNEADYNPQRAMAMMMGPGKEECRTEIPGKPGQRYGKSVLARAAEPGAFFMHSTAYYRDGASIDTWEKSIYTVAAFHNINVDNENSSPLKSQFPKRRASSASSTLFTESYAGSLRAPATIVWGQKDQACTEQICLDGIGDYLARDSQLVMLPKSGHWTAVEVGSRSVLTKILEHLVKAGDIGKQEVEEIISKTYEGAFLRLAK